MAKVIEGASLVEEFRGAYTNVLTYKQRCDACGYLARKNYIAFSFSTLEHDAYYDTEGFVCPDCAKYQAVRIRVVLEEWATGFRENSIL